MHIYSAFVDLTYNTTDKRQPLWTYAVTLIGSSQIFQHNQYAAFLDKVASENMKRLKASISSETQVTKTTKQIHLNVLLVNQTILTWNSISEVLTS